MSMLMALALQVATESTPRSSINIEVDEPRDQFRIVVAARRSLKFDAYQLEIPHEGLPPSNVGVVVMNERGEVVGCGGMNEPRYAAGMSSSSRSVTDKDMVRVAKGKPYATPWVDSKSLFIFFDQCVIPARRGGYVKYQIQVEIETSKGLVSTKTEWLDFDGFRTSGWGNDDL
jgi:hypothetical protein